MNSESQSQRSKVEGQSQRQHAMSWKLWNNLEWGQNVIKEKLRDLLVIFPKWHGVNF